MALGGRPPLILVTGATGAVGPHVVNVLRAAGHPVRTLSIDPPPPGIWPDGVEALTGDVTDEAAVGSAMKNAGTVIHMAALLHVLNPPPALREEYERINVGGTAKVVAAARQAGAGRVVLFSTIAVYGPSHGKIWTEETPPRPDTFYARSKLAAERIVLEAECADGSPLGVVLRLGAVYGPGIKGNYRRLVQALAKGRFIPVGDGSNRRSLLHEKDAAQAALLAADRPEAAGRTYNVTDGALPTMNDIIFTLCEILGRKPPSIALPLQAALWMAKGLEKAMKPVHLRPPVTADTLSKFAEDMAVDSRRIRMELGFAPRHDLASGWRETVREMKQAGLL